MKNGTPDHSRPSLCETCAHCLKVTGFAESQRHWYCNEISFGRNATIPWPVYECWGYRNKLMPTLSQMHSMAMLIEKKNGQIGFRRLTKEELYDGYSGD